MHPESEPEKSLEPLEAPLEGNASFPMDLPSTPCSSSEVFQLPIPEPPALDPGLKSETSTSYQSLSELDTPMPLMAGTNTGRISLPRKPGIPYQFWLMALLIPYAVAASVMLLYFLSQIQELRKIPHPLENLGDQGLYEDYFEGKRPDIEPGMEKAKDQPSSKYIELTKPLLSELPSIRLGETKRVGDLEIQPVEVTRQKIEWTFTSPGVERIAGEGLVLLLRIKNAGQFIFQPDDPTFNRAFLSSEARIHTFLQLADRRFYGAISDPHKERLKLTTLGPLQPGESGEMNIVAWMDARQTIRASDAIVNEKQPVTWYVHVRKGKETVRLSSGKTRQVWTTALVPVVFDPKQVKP